jgi:ubiquinone/menaquinone biosynthesis C-methylase UbiE
MSAFLRLFFGHLYTTLAWAYDFVAWSTSAGQWDRWRSVALDWIAPDTTVLELGPGTGHLLRAFRRRGQVAFGLERSPQMVRIARRRLASMGVAAPLARGRAQAQPFASNVFDAVVATFPSEYIIEGTTLAEIYRCLKPGGRLALLTAAWPTGPKLVDRLAGWLYRATGQALEPDGAWTQALRAAPIPLEVETVMLPRGMVVVVGKKDR